MYRNYEDPLKLTSQLHNLEAQLLAARIMCDEDLIFDLEQERAELKDRIRLAWDDDEYDSQKDN